MIPLFTRAEMVETDRLATEQYGIPSSLLMESAGAQAAAHIRRVYAEQLERVLIIGGSGQNGGDGWVVARHLHAHGHAPRCVLVGDPARVLGDARANLASVRALGIEFHALNDGALDQFTALAGKATLVIDALFGTGLKRPLDGIYAEIVRALAERNVPVCALDVPSGIDADTGQVLGSAVRAHSTVTFAGHKRGLHQHPGVGYAGAVECVGIGMRPRAAADVGLIERSDVARILVPSSADAHKGTRGHLIAIAGSQGKTGAALLAALGALRAGAGLVTVASDSETCRALDQKVIEVMTAAVDGAGADKGAGELAQLLALAEGKAAALLGPGFGTSPTRASLARSLAAQLPVPCVLDADALTAHANALETLRGARGPRILTPHPAEAGRLLGCSTAAVQADRYAAVVELARRSGQVAVLKGARTLIAAPDGRLRVCRAGTPALGVAGTGDVLSGVLAALSARTEAFDAAWAGVELHATAGELAAQSDRGMLASEVAHALPRALEHIRREAFISGASVPLA